MADDEGKPEIVRRHLLFSDVVLKTFQRGVDVSESLRSIPCQLELSWILAISLYVQGAATTYINMMYVVHVIQPGFSFHRFADLVRFPKNPVF